MTSRAKFNVGQIVHHARFDYRGVIVDVDANFSGSEAWYEKVAKSRPPKDQPWYRVLVDGADYETYVAERHLEADLNDTPVMHPDVETHFAGYEDGRYLMKRH